MLNETLTVSGQQLVKFFTNEEKEIAKYGEMNSKLSKIKVKEKLAGRWYRLMIRMFMNLGPVLIYFFAGILILNYDSTVTIGELAILVALMNKMYRPINQLMDIQENFVKGLALFSRVFEYLDLEIDIVNAENPLVLKVAKGQIEFKNVCFSYSKDKKVLNNLNFTVDKGEMVAIVGASGAGKSTIINLLTRMYDVTEGAILFDNRDLRELDLNFLRSQIGVVSQENYLFNGTIRENLLYANSDATEEELIEACEKAYIYNMINELPEKLDTIVGNRGVRLSGGEIQRISIARMLLKEPKLFVLDEATSALDSISENLIQKALEPILKETTSIVIAHRISTIIQADKIIVVESGEILEMGNHAQLIEKNGSYKKLYDTQFDNL